MLSLSSSSSSSGALVRPVVAAVAAAATGSIAAVRRESSAPAPASDAERVSRLAPAVLRLSDAVMEYGKGSWLYDSTGREYLDFSTGIGVTSTGHCHPRVVAAIQHQAGRAIHLQQQCVVQRPMLDLIDSLQQIPSLAHSSINQFAFANSGAEAIECAVKLARHATGRPNVITFQGGYHGRTLLTGAMTSAKTAFSAGFQPLPAGIIRSPFPYCYQCYGRRMITALEESMNGTAGPSGGCASSGGGACQGNGSCGGGGNTSSSSSPSSNRRQLAFLDDPGFECCGRCDEEIQLTLLQQSAPADTAAIVVEPILGEGGYVPAPRGFLTLLRRICDQHGILLIVDEVQSGFGRTGRWFGFEHDSEDPANPTPNPSSVVKPDIVVMAKGIASGMPISVIGSRAEIMGKAWPGSMGGTYGGNVVACAAANATLSVIRDEGLVENADRQGRLLRRRLAEAVWRNNLPVGDIRGRGLMVGVEFDAHRPEVGAGFTKRLTKECGENQGLLLLSCGLRETVRFIPPLTVSAAEIESGVERFTEAVKNIIK